MVNTVRELLTQYDNMRRATDNGTCRHAMMQGIVVDADGVHGNAGVVMRIKSRSDLAKFFTVNSRPEVPVAGVVRNCFISRRVDRLIVDDVNKIVCILDYKTDVDKDAMQKQYFYKMREYKELLQQVYVNYRIEMYILWLHDWTLQEIK